MYPPGIPLLIAGEEVTAGHLLSIMRIREGGLGSGTSITGASDDSLSTLRIIRFEPTSDTQLDDEIFAVSIVCDG